MSLSTRAASVLSGAAAAAAAALGGAFGTPPTRALQPAQPTAFSSSGTVAPAPAVSDGCAGATGGDAESTALLRGAGPESSSSQHSDSAAADPGRDAGSAQGAIPLGLVSLSRRSLTDGAWVCCRATTPGGSRFDPSFSRGELLGLRARGTVFL